MTDRSALGPSPLRAVLVQGCRIGTVHAYGSESHLVEVDGETSWLPIAQLEFVQAVEDEADEVGERSRVILESGQVVLIGRTVVPGLEG